MRFHLLGSTVRHLIPLGNLRWQLGSLGLAGFAVGHDRRVLHLREILLRQRLEARGILAADRGAHGELLRQRIDLPAAAMELVVQVRAGRHAGRADEADHLALAHRDAGLDAGPDAATCARRRWRRRWCAAASRRCRSRRWSLPCTTLPVPAARIGVPGGAAKSTPACKALKPRIGCSRMPKRDVIFEASIGVRRKERTTLSPWGL